MNCVPGTHSFKTGNRSGSKESRSHKEVAKTKGHDGCSELPWVYYYYRKFMFRYAQIAKPLNELTSGENANKKNKDVDWLPKHQESFKRLKELSLGLPVLAYADYKKPFKVYTDASEKGLGAVLAQRQEDGSEPAIAFASRTLSKAEKRYDAHKLEFLALKWAITDRFHEYLYGGEFDVFTDNNPLTYVLMTAKLDATGQRWVAMR